jgi:hypothetical protein
MSRPGQPAGLTREHAIRLLAELQRLLSPIPASGLRAG